MDPELSAGRPVVLLAEDEAIIAMDIEDSLRAAGFAVAGPFATCAQAEAWLETGAPDAAVLDHVLRDGRCDALIASLSRRGVPAVIFTGDDARRRPPGERATVMWVTKPIGIPALLHALRRAMRAAGASPRKRPDPPRSG
jgi:DNA-binding response OmpR family regulator